MGVSYNRLWKLLIDKNMKRIEMQNLTGISGNILARMGKNQYVSMETVEKICKKLGCSVDEMMEFTDDEVQEVAAMTDAQQRAAAKIFAKNWKDRGYEKGDSQIFWVELLTTVFGVTDISQFIS